MLLFSPFTYEDTVGGGAGMAGSERGRNLPTSHSQKAEGLDLHSDLPETDVDAFTGFANLPSPLSWSGVRIRVTLDFRAPGIGSWPQYLSVTRA